MKATESSFQPFSYLHALCLGFSIITYIADISLDVILAITYFLDGFYGYCFITVFLVVSSTVLVQIFSVRWHQMDEEINKATYIIHSTFLGVVHRYFVVVSYGFTAMNSGDSVDYQRYYQQQSDVCMLRLFDSFLESAPQLVFQLYVMVIKAQIPSSQLIWTGVSAIVSTISLGWGIAAYNSALRMVRTDKAPMTWTGMILQTAWRAGMLTARITALLLLSLMIHEWVIIALFIHWLVMTLWVVFQDTDFAPTLWEERLYNAVVGVIYCFCFFNLKEGRSRVRATVFYLVVITENLSIAALFVCATGQNPSGWTLLGLTFVVGGTVLGLTSMLLYYRFYHPAGPIDPCPPSFDDSYVEKTPVKAANTSSGPDFEIHDNDQDRLEGGVSPASAPPPRPPRQRGRVQYSRSFKDACPSSNRVVGRRGHQQRPAKHGEVGQSPQSGSPGYRVPTALDSAYGTDSNRTMSRSTASPPQLTPEDQNVSNGSGSSQAFNNETYMSLDRDKSPCESMISPVQGHRRSRALDSTSDFSQCSQSSAASKITVIDRKSDDPRHHPEKLLKRSPIVKDVVTSAFAQVKALPREEEAAVTKAVGVKTNNGGPLTAPLTIIIPNISHQAFARSSRSPVKLTDKTIPLDLLNPKLPVNVSTHDYENLALVNINRAAFGISHWRTYSDMAGNGHDESTAYERKKASHADYSNYGSLQYYDIYPLSREMKDQLYRSLTPCSTAATIDGDSNNATDSSDTYEPIEAFSGAFSSTESTADSNKSSTASMPLTLIRHDGKSMVTRQVVSLDNLKEALMNHDSVPMDDPCDRGDLYLLAPMRLLTPIIEESEHDITTKTEATTASTAITDNYAEVHRSILSVISEILASPYQKMNHFQAVTKSNVATETVPEPETPEQVSGITSSLVHTIDEIRNTSLCNLFFSSPGGLGPAKPTAAPQVPKRNGSSGDLLLRGSKLNASVKSINSNTLVPSPDTSRRQEAPPGRPKPVLPQKSNLSHLTCPAKSRKNILELAGDNSDTILNTPKRPEKSMALQIHQDISIDKPVSSTTTINSSSLHSVSRNSMPLSPSSTYETPTPPLRPNQFVRGSLQTRPTRRKFSFIRDRFEANHDLYQNISNDLLDCDLSQINQRSPAFIDSKEFGLKSDERYENLQRGFATSSMREKVQGRDKENQSPPPALGPKPGPRAVRLGSLSPNAKIFGAGPRPHHQRHSLNH